MLCKAILLWMWDGSNKGLSLPGAFLLLASIINGGLLSRTSLIVSRLGLVVRRWAGKRKEAGSTQSPASAHLFLSSKNVIYGHCLVTDFALAQLMKQ